MERRMKTLTSPAKDQTLYFVLLDYGRSKEFTPTDPDKNSLRQVIVDIASGQLERPIQILECNPVEGTCRDVSEDVAKEVYSRIQDGGDKCPEHLRDFFEAALHVGAADLLDISTGHFNVERTAMRIRHAVA
jgi:hypothetical protein